MAGTVFGLALSQQFNNDGTPMAGGMLYVFEAGTLTPLDTFTDTGLTAGNEHAHPIILDSNGRIPAFWVRDGTARARLTNAAGVVQFDENLLILGASAGGGGGGDTTDVNSVFQTGDLVFRHAGGARTGWVRCNGRTIGNAASGGTERANADTADLFTYLWTNFSDTLCPVSGGRGASAAADYAANKTITLPDMRSRSAFGVDDMGNSAASRLSSSYVATGNQTTGGSSGGDDDHTLTSAQMPSHTHIQDPHNHGIEPLSEVVVAGGATWTTVRSDGNFGTAGTPRGTTENTTATNQNTGGGGAHNNMPPFILGTWYIFLG
jgi:microcystin-dependent protein